MEPRKDNEIPEAEICFKCKTKIPHVPYKFEGKFFHARCLLCNTCGRRLIGKPFLTADRQIFCNNKCQQLFQSESPRLQPTIAENSYSRHSQVHSLPVNELPEKMHSSNTYYHQAGGLVNGGGYNWSPSDGGRVTDYPVASLPNHNYSHSFQSETDSQSTMSESSFTSDSSFAFDANRKPRKKILKKSNGPRRRHHRRVTWKLDNNESFNDADNVSIDSSSSLSSSGMSYHRAQDLAYLHFHSNPALGGDPAAIPRKITEYPQYNNQFVSPPPSSSNGGTINGGYKLPQSMKPNSSQHSGLYRTYSGSVYHSVGGTNGHQQQPSPLPSEVAMNGHSSNKLPRYHTFSHQDLKQGYIRHSSPISNNQMYDSNSSLNDSMDRVINVPVFHLDDVPELNESNVDERNQRNLFEFPPVSSQKKKPSTLAKPGVNVMNPVSRSRSSSDVSNPQSLTSNSSSSMSSLSTSSFTYIPNSLKTASSPSNDSPKFISNRHQGNSSLKKVPENVDEEPDYDHLEEQHPSGNSTPSPSTIAQTSSKPPPNSNIQWYSSDDIEEALQIIEGSENSEEEEEQKVPSSPPPVPPKKKGKPPPPIPPKKQVLNSILAQDLTVTDSSYNESMDRLVLSPPHDFKTSVEPTHRHDPLHSPSSETLMSPEGSSSLSDSNLTPLADSDTNVHVYPESSKMNPRPSWTRTMEDRIIEGAEDPQWQRTSPTSAIVYKPGASLKLSAPLHQSSPRYEVDKVSKGLANLSMDNMHGPHQQQRRGSLSSRQDQPPTESYHLRRSKTLPRNLTFTKEDRAVLQWRKERPTMKPIVIDTDKEIDQLMNEVERDRQNSVTRRTNPKHSNDSSGIVSQPLHGVSCFSCKKAIYDSNSLVNFASRTYHASCFCCPYCRRELTKEDQIYTLKGVLVCSNDYKMVMAKQQQDELKKEQQQQHQSPKKQTFNRSHSASLLSSSKTSSRKVVISPPIQMLEGSRVA